MPSPASPDIHGSSSWLVPGSRELRMILIGLLLTVLLAALDQTIVATALPTIVGDLNGLEHISWVITAYMISSTITLPIYGKLGDLYGRKTLFLFSAVVFLVGSVLCGVAGSMWQLILFRAVQGIGGGGIFTGATAILADVLAPRDRGRYMGLIGAAFGIASVAGPLLGGFLTDALSWRWVFYVNLPLGALALFFILKFLHLGTPKHATPPRIDYLGIILMVIGSSSLILVSSWGGTVYPWGSPQIMALIALAVVSVALFIAVELRVKEPLIPLGILKDPNVWVCVFMGVGVSAAMMSVGAYLPTFFQMVWGVSATVAGLMILPMTFAQVAATIISGRLISATGNYKLYLVAGPALIILGLFGFSLIDQHTSYLWLSVLMVVICVGIGFTLQNTLLVVQNSVPPRDIGAGTSTTTFIRQLGASLGIAVSGSLFIGNLTAFTQQHSAQMTAHSLNAQQLSSLTPQVLASLPETAQQLIAEAFSTAMPPIFLFSIPAVLLSFVLSFFIRQVPLQK
ncbi:MDR family MFS transporter [Rothia sp. P7208]|uniref:MDR family MFS transporter n=1 Tax=Rothia sp. P7208 TaxID=3402660 RepID=UPI003ACD81D4